MACYSHYCATATATLLQPLLRHRCICADNDPGSARVPHCGVRGVGCSGSSAAGQQLQLQAAGERRGLDLQGGGGCQCGSVWVSVGLDLHACHMYQLAQRGPGVLGQ